MAKMKDSGVKWIGEIPNTWNIKKVKYLATQPESIFKDGDWIESDVIIDEGIRYLTTGNVGAGYFKEQGSGYISGETFKKLKCLKVLPEDLMISRLNEPIGRACMVPDTEDMYVVAVDNVILRPDEIYDKKFIMYCMNTTGYAEAGKDAARGSTMQRVSRSLLGNFYIPIAHLKEQQLIASFLDDKVGRIDEILNDLNSQIKILDKYKKSLITETVTKGVNSTVEMKNSGIDWIGMVPEHWDIYYLKHLFEMFAGGDVDEYDFSDEYTELTPYPIYSNSLENNGLFGYMSKYRFSGKTFTVTGRGDVGKAIARDNAYYPIVRLLVCIPKFKDDTRYYAYCVNSADLLGEQTAMAQLTTQKLGINKFPRPPIKEQQRIADYLDKKCDEIDGLISDKKAQIEKIQEYKKLLIYEYVTGKKRVKGAEELYG